MIRSQDPWNGVVVIDKPAGVTSHDVVNQIRRIFGLKRVGHTGTLDPLATGVLALCLGQATRIVEYLSAQRKEYSARITFGVETDTQDVTGRILSQSEARHLARESVEQVLEGFSGQVLQIPPMVSAIHHNGKRLYELARAGLEVERTPRAVTIYRLALMDFVAGNSPQAVLQVECSTGTYIRTLAADIGRAVGLGAMLHSLRRTRMGAFSLDDCFTLAQLGTMRERNELSQAVRSIASSLAEWPRVMLNATQLESITHGRAISAAAGGPGLHLLMDDRGNAVSIAERRNDDQLVPVKVLRNPE